MARQYTAKQLERTVREICLELPEADEKETWGHPTFRIRDKIFVGFGTSEEGVSTLAMKAPPGVQEALLGEGHPGQQVGRGKGSVSTKRCRSLPHMWSR